MQRHTVFLFSKPILKIILIITSIIFSVNNSANIDTIDPLKKPAQLTRHITNSVMLAVTRTASERLVSVGERGRIFLSDDNGYNWEQAEVPVSVTLTAVSFANENLGWAVGHSGTVIATENGGKTWEKQLNGNDSANIELSEAEKFAQANPDNKNAKRRLRSAKFLVEDGPDKPFLDVNFINEKIGYIIGAYGLAYKTENGGQAWHSIQGSIDNLRGNHLYQIHLTEENIFIVGEQGTLFRSGAFEDDFQKLDSPYIGSWFGMISGNNNQQLVFGLKGNLFSTDDQGNTWKKEEIQLPVTLTNGIKLQDGVLALVDESGQLLINNAKTNIFSPAKIPQSATFTDITQAGDNSLILTSTRGITRINYDTSTKGFNK